VPDRVRWQQTFHLVALKPGDLTLPLTPLRFREDPDVPWQEVIWQPIAVRVTTEILNADLSELRDVSPPEQLPAKPSLMPLILWSAAALAFIGISATTWQVLRRRSERPVLLPPDAWALQELDRLPLPDEFAGPESYYTKLSDILRQYLKLRFELPALERTTEEFLAAMRQAPQLMPEQQDLLRDFLERCDLMKFARVTSTLQESQKLAETARRFVQQTTSPTGKAG
jgi:hypothetical protein